MPKKKAKKTWFFIISALIIIGAVVVIAVVSNKEAPIKVQVSKVKKRTITQSVSANGRIKPETQIKVSSETSGEIIYLGPQEGDTVKKDELIVKIKPDIIQTQLEQYKAASEAAKMQIDVNKAELERAEADLKRMTELYKKEFISKQEYDRAKAAYNQAQSSYKAALSKYEQSRAGYRQIQRNAERTTIESPISGIVTSLSVEEGEKVVGTEMMQGTDIMRISDLSVMNAVVDVDENDIVLVSLGDTARIEIDAFPDSVFIGKVVEVGHSAKVSQLGSQDQVTNFEVKIRVLNPDPRFRPGMSCNVDIETETRQGVLAVPLQAVTVREEGIETKPDVQVEAPDKKDDKKLKKDRPQSVVFTKNENKAKLVEVETGISDRGFIEIKEGLEEDQEIISGSFMAVSKKLKDGSLIEVDTTTFKKFGKKE